MTTGKVYLVGAGPGDRELLTVKAVRLIKEADVIVYDRLVSESIMDLIPEGAELIDVGKNVGNHPVPQHEINRILLREAQAGKQVVRLKGGDPFVFGRGGEELELLLENGIGFEVVPGITSSIAVPAYAGIPVTHRDYCSSLHIITGHAKAGADLQIDFDALVRLNGTLIFMMSVSTAGRIAAGLMEAGMAKDMPCAVIENGTYPKQRKFISDLEHIEETLKANQVKSPAVIAVGRVCALSDRFDWFDKKPLKGKRIVITQPRSKASRLEEKLKALGAETKLYPCIRTAFIRPLDPPFEESDTLVFTSAEGVKSFFGWLFEEGRDARCISGKKLACIGSATADALREYGLCADFVPSVYDGIHLGREMIESGFVDENSRVILLRAKIGTRDLTEALEKAGITYLDYPVYETSYVSHEEIEDLESWDYVTFTSRSCVDGFVKTQKRESFSGVRALCIGTQTAGQAEEYGFDTVVSDMATIDSMIEKIRSDCND
ncbi:MAG: uroporphyrinogen-III C-methyltransferase [Emergencia sp.]